MDAEEEEEAEAAETEAALPRYASLQQFLDITELNGGAGCNVYSATCAATRAQVVLKVYAKRRLSARRRSELAHELALLRRLRGPCVVRLLGSFETDKEARTAAMRSPSLAHRALVR